MEEIEILCSVCGEPLTKATPTGQNIFIGSCGLLSHNEELIPITVTVNVAAQEYNQNYNICLKCAEKALVVVEQGMITTLRNAGRSHRRVDPQV